MPYVLVGVLTQTKISCDSRIAFFISVEKNRFFPLHCFTIASKPNYKKHSSIKKIIYQCHYTIQDT